jgi:hypothetical protein
LHHLKQGQFRGDSVFSIGLGKGITSARLLLVQEKVIVLDDVLVVKFQKHLALSKRLVRVVKIVALDLLNRKRLAVCFAPTLRGGKGGKDEWG